MHKSPVSNLQYRTSDVEISKWIPLSGPGPSPERPGRVVRWTVMGGRNPYFDELDGIEAPTEKYTVTFLPMNVTVEVDPDRLPYQDTGLPGSLLDIALAHGIEIDHACGGVCACSTCHCIVEEGEETLSEMSDGEEDQLAYAPGLTPSSRLACQAVANGASNLLVRIPAWNRNLVREEH